MLALSLASVEARNPVPCAPSRVAALAPDQPNFVYTATFLCLGNAKFFFFEIFFFLFFFLFTFFSFFFFLFLFFLFFDDTMPLAVAADSRI